MRILYKKHKNEGLKIISNYASAELNGIVKRKSNKYLLSAKQYAEALYRDGIGKGWIYE
jgi:hypothetical protein